MFCFYSQSKLFRKTLYVCVCVMGINQMIPTRGLDSASASESLNILMPGFMLIHPHSVLKLDIERDNSFGKKCFFLNLIQ